MEGPRIFLGLALITISPALRDQRGVDRCPFDNLNIPHGWYTFTSIFQTMVEYTCNDGFFRYGKKTLYCVDSSWTAPPPKCITNTCQDILVEEPLRVERQHNGSLLKFSCAVMNQLEGTEIITCDGSAWSDTVPTCIPATPATSCDFEDPALCGWYHHDDTNVEWRQQMGNTDTERTGPEHDHTYGSAGNGHYLYFESSNPVRRGHKAILLSPLYPSSYSRRCFDFWYHILATGNVVAKLEVFIKPESKSLDELPCTEFSVNENKGESWLNHTVLVSDVSEPFQIVFVATRGTSFRSDIAIDDVMLYTCPEHFPTTTTSSPTIRTNLRRTFAQSPITMKTSSARTSSSTSSKQSCFPLVYVLLLLCSNYLFQR